jgi:hypothetical protein
MSEASSEVRTPALFDHCSRVYELMLSEAKSVKEAGVDMIVWEGFPTNMLRDQLRLSNPYYTHVFRALKAMNCVRQLRRGGSSTPSQWELIHEPSVKAFLETLPKEPSASEVRLDGIEQAQRDIIRRLERLEQVTHVASVPIDFISDPTPPGGIRVSRVEDDPSAWLDDEEIDHENADKFGAE